MKYIKWIVLGVVVVIAVAVAVVWLNLNGIVRRTVEAQATDSLSLPTTLGSANVSLLGGSVGLRDLKIGSPQGFESPQMFALRGINVGVSLGQLRSDPIGIDQIVIDKPRLVIEQAGGKFNFQALMDLQSKQPTGDKAGDGRREEGEPIRVIIRDLQVNQAQVVLRPGIPGLAKEITIPIPSFHLKDIGSGEGNKNGAAIKEVVMLTVTSLADRASQSDLLPAEVRQLLSLNVQQVAQRMKDELNKQVGKLTEDLGKKLPGDLGKDAGQAIEKGLGGLLDKGKKPGDSK